MAGKIKRGSNQMDVASLNFSVKQFGEPEDRVLRFIGSDETPDRDGDIISMNGWDISNYTKNPVFLWAHDASIPPVGKANNVFQENGKLLFDIEFPEKGVYPFADVVYNLYKGGFLNATSVGFVGKEIEARSDEAVKDLPEWRRGVKFLSQELLELSAVPVPSNPSALQQAKSIGAVTDDEYSSLMSFINGEYVTNPHVGAKTLRGIKSVYDAQEDLEEEKKMAKEKTDATKEEQAKEEPKVEDTPKAEPETTIEPESKQPSVMDELVIANSGHKTFVLDVKSGKVVGDITEQLKSAIDIEVEKAIAKLGLEEKAGASISKKNKSRLSQAKDLIIEVLGTVETETSEEEEKGTAIIEDEEELTKPNNVDMAAGTKSADTEDSKGSQQDETPEKEEVEFDNLEPDAEVSFEIVDEDEE